MRKLSVKFAAIIVFITLGTIAIAAQGAPSPQMVAAGELLKAGKFSEASAAYEAIVKADPANAAAWYQLAAAEYSLKNYERAAEAYQKNISISDSPFGMYNLACVYSLMGRKDSAIEWLTKAADNPKAILQTINFSDPDLSAIKDDPRVKSLADKIDRKIRPCMYQDEAKQFNFWVGEWEVYNPQGRHDGSSVIQSFAAGCGILENWTSALGGGGGKSINFYDPDAKKWFQYWMGSNGVPTRYSGVYRDGAMRYEGEFTAADGKRNLLRLTFFNIDSNTVRQFSQSSNDDGKTWTTNYDYKYVRRNHSN